MLRPHYLFWNAHCHIYYNHQGLMLMKILKCLSLIGVIHLMTLVLNIGNILWEALKFSNENILGLIDRNCVVCCR